MRRPFRFGVIKRFLITIVWIAIYALLPANASASQVYGHLYFAEMMLRTEPGSYINRHDSSRAAFLLGSLSPDSAWIAHMLTQPEVRSRLMQRYEVKFPRNLPEHTSHIEDIHQKLPRHFALQLIRAAVSDEEQAFAIGWLSHYAADSYMHDLINRHGGFVEDSDHFDSAAMKMHDYLEALEMRHVFQLDGELLRNAADAASHSKMPLKLLQDVFANIYPNNPYFTEHSQDFNRYMTLSSKLMLDSTRWYGYQSQHSPIEIERIKRLIRRFRPNQGKLLDILPNLPTMQQYETEKASGPFLRAWRQRSLQLNERFHALLVNATAYYWWRSRRSPLSRQIADLAIDRIDAELQGMNPADNLMQPRQAY